MIKNIAASGKYLQVSGGSGSTYVGNNSGAQGVGNMRYNTVTQNIEIYDGFSWTVMNTGYPSIGLTGEAESILDWAKKKMREENEIEELAKTNPTIADLQKQIKEKQEQIRIVRNLTEIEVKIA
jgi:hypothetical protein